jgi:hypothetical protein
LQSLFPPLALSILVNDDSFLSFRFYYADGIDVTRTQLHDQLLASKPDGVNHETCELCAPEDPSKGGPTKVTTYTEDDMQAAVETATAALTARVVELQSAAQESEIDARIASVKEEAAAEVEELRAQLDDMVLAKAAAEDALASFQAALEELATAEAHEAEIASRRESRIAQVKEHASFPEAYVEQNADRFAAMSDEDFEARLSEWASLSHKTAGDGIPKTALTASREPGADTTNKGLLREVMRDSLYGKSVDPRTL